jgi:predicted dienelactone hydrolase
MEALDKTRKHRVRDWLESTFALPVGIEGPELTEIAATIQTEQDFDQFQQAALRQKKPRGWRVFVKIALECQKHQATYAKAMAAGAGAGETLLERQYREEMEKRRAEEKSHD